MPKKRIRMTGEQARIVDESQIDTTGIDLDALFPPRTSEQEAELARQRATAPDSEPVEDVLVPGVQGPDPSKSEQYNIQFLL